jgi:hypothetical protein
MILPQLYNDLLGRGGTEGTTDAFGIEWEWVEVAGGSMVRPGEPFLENVNEWEDNIIFPDIESWDWAKSAAETRLDARFPTQAMLINGFWFERLVSFMDFGPAAVALIDEDQKGAVHRLFEAMSHFATRVIDCFCEYWPALDGFNIHDDWGGQKSPFFSDDVAREMFVPYMRILTDHIHKKGRYVTLHSCGHTETRIQHFIDAGFDAWDPQIMNDTHKLYDEYGDKILIYVIPEHYDADTASEEEQRQRARDFVDRFVNLKKPALLGFYALPYLTSAFSEELYRYSRIRWNSI